MTSCIWPNLRLDSSDMQLRRNLALYVLAAALVLFAAGFVVRVSAKGQLDELAQFLIDRREGAGQTQPDRGATCTYDLRDNTLLIERKAHGQTTSHELTLADTLVEPHFAGQQALIETATTADTYNCINGEFESHTLAADKGNPIGRVLFSGTGRTVAITLRRNNQERGAEIFAYKANPGDSIWNDHFGPGGDAPAGIQGHVIKARLVGESLVVVFSHFKEVQIHTYNFRAGHKKTPWNEFSQKQIPFTVVGEIVGGVAMPNRGKQAEIRVRDAGKETTYSFDFTCTQNPGDAANAKVENDKPCIWQAK